MGTPVLEPNLWIDGNKHVRTGGKSGEARICGLTCTPLGVMSSCLARLARMTPLGFLSRAKVCSRISSWAGVVLLRCFISLGMYG